MEGDDPTARREDGVLAGGGGASHADGDGLTSGVLHLRGDGTHPDQLVDPELVTSEPGLGRCAERVAGGPDRLVGLLGVLDLGGVGPWGVGDVFGAVQLADLLACGPDRRAGERGGVGPHVGDVATLVEPLGHRHRHAGAHAELAAGFLLQRRGAERRVGRTAVGLRLDRADVERRVGEGRGERLGAGPVEVDDVVLLEHTVLAEVAASGHPGTVEGMQLRREHALLVLATRVEGAFEVPVGGELELHPLPLAVDHEPGGH